MSETAAKPDRKGAVKGAAKGAAAAARSADAAARLRARGAGRASRSAVEDLVPQAPRKPAEERPLRSVPRADSARAEDPARPEVAAVPAPETKPVPEPVDVAAEPRPAPQVEEAPQRRETPRTTTASEPTAPPATGKKSPKASAKSQARSAKSQARAAAQAALDRSMVGPEGRLEMSGERIVKMTLELPAPVVDALCLWERDVTAETGQRAYRERLIDAALSQMPTDIDQIIDLARRLPQPLREAEVESIGTRVRESIQTRLKSLRPEMRMRRVKDIYMRQVYAAAIAGYLADVGVPVTRE